jgi:hypothetical protein
LAVRLAFHVPLPPLGISGPEFMPFKHAVGFKLAFSPDFAESNPFSAFLGPERRLEQTKNQGWHHGAGFGRVGL